MYPNSSKGLNKETTKAVYFFTPAFHPLDNFSAHTVNLWGQKFPTAEHAFQWKKFSQSQPAIAKKILLSKNPHQAQEIATKNKSKIPADWHPRKVKVMESVLMAKAKQHQDVQAILKRTGGKKIIENSPVDAFWGIGKSGKGKNMVGVIWMKIRDTLD